MNVFTKLKIVLGRIGVRTLGQTSEGIKLVTSKGLTSGIMLDYIYRNQPQGRFIIGRWIDKIYLSHRAWEDVRVRKANLVKLLTMAIDGQRALNRTPVIVDVAAGSARYLIDVKSLAGMEDVAVVCRDLNAEALAWGKQNAELLGIKGMQFITGDAMSREALQEIQPQPNVAVSSGFYDWINEEEVVRKSMSLIYDILPAGGSFVFTNQVRHVNQEFVEGVFIDLHGSPLRMTMRPAAVMNRWAQEIGFKIVITTGDENYNYSVTLAQK